MSTGTRMSQPTSGGAFPVQRIRDDFPVLNQRVNGQPLVYLDNASTAQKPRVVIDTLSRYYAEDNANIHRAIHTLAERATQAYERTRSKVREFINAADSREIIFVRGTTEGINLAAQSYARSVLTEGDEIIVSAMEHHSNIVPWQLVCQQVGARLRVIPVDDDGELLVDEYRRLLSERTKLVALAHVSNVLGTINPVKQMIEMAHSHGAPVLLDGAQAVPHLRVDVRDLDCDFYAFSSHKLYGPTGVGALYGKADLLEEMPPYQGGGEMIASVTFEKTQYNVLPYKFEAGTPNIAGVVGLGAAIDYVQQVGLSAAGGYEHELLDYATGVLAAIPGLQIIGTAREKASVISFVIDGIHAHDLGTILDQHGVAIRAGHHCAMPLMQRFGVPATARASFAFYNTREEVDALARAVDAAIEVFG
ncbi:MAG: SufS family cysteine desulfurase [Chloroflexi bacterium]|nr:SufS family cysteine desulfurase [Chloroflexota bacterium]